MSDENETAESEPLFTTTLVLDRQHVEELRIVWPTWRAFRPEIFQQPLLIVCDVATAEPPHERWWYDQLQFVLESHPDPFIIFTDGHRDLPQRERMLTEFVYCPHLVETPWYLKLDTDVVATRAGRWFDPEWFADERIAFTASPWGYTKPASHLAALDAWAATQPTLACFPPPPRQIEGDVAKHSRIISWLMFGNTAWTKDLAGLFGTNDRLPVPSQDTVLHYIAARTNTPYRTVSMKQFGWAHIGRSVDRLRQTAAEALAAAGVNA